MTKPSDVAATSALAAARAALAAASFWLGSQPILIGVLAYIKLWLGEGVGYERGLGGFVLGTLFWGLLTTVPAVAVFITLFIALLTAGMFSRKTASMRDWHLYVVAGVLGLLFSGVLWCLS